MTLEELKEKKVTAISLGCDKNRVDLEKMLYDLKQFGFTITDDIENSEIIIVNTCAFISSAVNEAIQNILLAVSQKAVKCEKVIVTGCMVERFNNEINDLFKEVDAFVNVKNDNQIVETILKLYGVEAKHIYKSGRLLTTMPHYAYLKIADGCSNGCAYCTIPRIRGRYKSEQMEDLIDEAKTLAKDGVKELILVAQDLTRYGIDLYGQVKLVELIKQLSKIKGIHWIRLHYCYPEMVTDELLDEINNNDKVCKYIDVPFQHIDDKILKDMNRKSSEQDILNLVQKLNEKYPEIAIRSTFIVGFPGETKKQFNRLCDFLKEYKLDNVGFFPYYREEKTKAYFMKKQVWNIVKKSRLKKIQNIQEKIMNAKNLDLIGSECEVLIDDFDETTGMYLARSQKNSPGVDFYIMLEETPNIKIGEFFKVKLVDFINGYFKGEIIYESTK